MPLKHRRGASFAFVVLMLAASLLSLVPFAPKARALVQYNSGDPTPDEQLVLEYINRARSNPVAEGQRLGIDIHEGLQDPNGPDLVGPRPPLAMNPALLATAQAHSEDMYNQNYFSHTDPNGTTAFERMTNAGYDYVRAGENMAAGSDISAADLEDFMMVDSGTPGRPHRVNLLDIFPYPCGAPPCAYQEVGIGYYEGSNPNGIGNAFITEDFGATADTGPFLMGVVYNDANGNNFYDIGEGIAGVTITPDSGAYYAITSTSGGYAFPIATSGTLTVTASGPGFGPITQTVTLTGTNIELDFTPNGASTTATTVSQPVTQTSSGSLTQTTAQSTTQTSLQFTTTTQSTTHTSFQTSTQTTFSSTQQPLLQPVMFQSTPSDFPGVISPATISACGSTYESSQSAPGCGIGFTATANLPTPSTGWEFNHWTWAGGVACSSNTANPASCSAYNSGGVLIAVYAAQVNVVTNPASSALVSWGSCSNKGVGNGGAFFSTSFGSTTVAACDLPAGYSFSSWACSGGLVCSASSNPTTVTFTGPGKIALNLQIQVNQTSTTMLSSTMSATAVSSTSLSVTSMLSTFSTATVPTAVPIPGFTFESVMMGLVLGIFLAGLVRSRMKRKIIL